MAGQKRSRKEINNMFEIIPSIKPLTDAPQISETVAYGDTTTVQWFANADKLDLPKTAIESFLAKIGDKPVMVVTHDNAVHFYQ